MENQGKKTRVHEETGKKEGGGGKIEALKGGAKKPKSGLRWGSARSG